jgi:hypothetical protein
MNKKEALIAMIEGKKVINTKHEAKHHYKLHGFEFVFCDASEVSTRAVMQEFDEYEVLVIKKDFSQDFHITPRSIQMLKDLTGDEFVNLCMNKDKSARASMKITISWQEEE